MKRALWISLIGAVLAAPITILAAGSLRAENAKPALKPNCPIPGATVTLMNGFKDEVGYMTGKQSFIGQVVVWSIVCATLTHCGSECRMRRNNRVQLLV